MKREKLLIAIKKTIDQLTNNLVVYYWNDCDRCNCGLLARNITGLEEKEFMSKRRENGGVCCWSDGVKLCRQTGIPINEVYGALREVGMSWEDIENVETLNDKKVLAAMGKNYIEFSDKENVIAYLKAWASIIEEEDSIPAQPAATPEPPQERIKIVRVAVDPLIAYVNEVFEN